MLKIETRRNTSSLYGDYSLVVKPGFVEPESRVRFSLAAQEKTPR